jgi:hypothetical protein
VFATIFLLMAAAALGASAPRPTSGRCAGAWNRSVLPSIRAVLARQHVRQATAENMSGSQGIDVVAAGGKTSGRSVRFEGCVIVFMLPRTAQTLTLIGTWKNGTVVKWSIPMYRRNTTPIGSGNACVADDGTIHRVGRFTATARCA